MSGRSLSVLGRLPRHFDAARVREDGSPAHLLGAVIDTISIDLDELSTDLGKVRRAHRIDHAETIHDILALAGLHGMRTETFAPLWRRIAGAADALRALGVAGDEPARKSATETALAAWGLELAGTLPAGQHPLILWAPPAADGVFDGAAAIHRLALHLAHAFSHRARLDLARTRVIRTAAVHADGNGTVAAMLRAAAAALDLDLDLARNRAAKTDLIARDVASIHPGLVNDDFLHSRDRFWHVSYARDRVRLSRPVLLPVPAGGTAPAVDATPLAQRHDLVVIDEPDGKIAIGSLARQLGVTLAELMRRAEEAHLVVTPITRLKAIDAAGLARGLGRDTISVLPTALDVIALEENPIYRESYPRPPAGPVEASHGYRFTVVRRGFGSALLRIRLTGVGTRTMAPMIVNRDAGHGVGFDGSVADGETLEVTEEGRVFLDGADVTSRAYSWRGGCFADDDDRVPGKDFVFAASPNSVGRHVLRFIVTQPAGALDRDAHFPTAGAAIETAPIGLNLTRYAYFVRVAHAGTERGGGHVDTVAPRAFAALFDQSVWADVPGAEPLVAGKIELSWLEHKAYAVRVLIPGRLKALDVGLPPAQTIPALVRAAIERVRPVGIDVEVAYIDELWSLGEGILPSAEDDPLSRVAGGTVLWPTPP